MVEILLGPRPMSGKDAYLGGGGGEKIKGNDLVILVGCCLFNQPPDDVVPIFQLGPGDTAVNELLHPGIFASVFFPNPTFQPPKGLEFFWEETLKWLKILGWFLEWLEIAIYTYRWKYRWRNSQEVAICKGLWWTDKTNYMGVAPSTFQVV